MTKARLVTAGEPVRRLGTRAPRQRGLGGIEALSSYLAGQALDHRCAPYTLFSDVLIPSEERLNKRWRRVRWGESQLVNSYGDVAEAVAAAVATCSGLSNSRRMTLLGLESACDPKAKHLMHAMRPWCSECYLEARGHGLAAWDPLYTYLRTSRVCVWHQHALQSTCAKCGLGQRYIPKFPFLDFCEYCGSDLAAQRPPVAYVGDEMLVHLWMSRAAMDIIDALSRERVLTHSHFASNIQLIISTFFDGQARGFANRLNLAGSSPKNWLRRASKPTWASLADISFRLDVPPSQLCSPEPPLTDPQYWRDRPRSTLDKPHVSPSKTKLTLMKRFLMQHLRMREPTGVAAPEGLERIAKKAGTSVAVLKRHFPEYCEKLVSQRKVILLRRREDSAQRRNRRILEAKEELKTKRLPVTSRNLKRTGKVRVADLVTMSRAEARE